MTRVLVVDDEPQILRALRVVLREADFEPVEAATADEALDRAAVRPPDAAIVDLVLPDGDGVDVAQRLREWSDTHADRVRPASDAGAPPWPRIPVSATASTLDDSLIEA